MRGCVGMRVWVDGLPGQAAAEVGDTKLQSGGKAAQQGLSWAVGEGNASNGCAPLSLVQRGQRLRHAQLRGHVACRPMRCRGMYIRGRKREGWRCAEAEHCSPASPPGMKPLAAGESSASGSMQAAPCAPRRWNSAQQQLTVAEGIVVRGVGLQPGDVCLHSEVGLRLGGEGATAGGPGEQKGNESPMRRLAPRLKTLACSLC